MNKNKTNLLSHKDVQDYIRHHFNPKKLPSLLTCLAQQLCSANPHGSKFVHSQQNNIKAIAKAMLNNSNLSLMLGNLKAYDNHRILRENCTIDTVSQSSSNFLVSSNLEEKSQRIEKCGNRLLTEMESNPVSNQVKPDRRISSKKQSQPNLLQFLDLCYQAFLIYEYRLKDLNAIIVILHNSTHNSSQHIDGLKEILEQLCAILLRKIADTKEMMDLGRRYYLDNAQNLSSAELNKICFPNLLKEDLPKLLYRITSYAKKYKIKIDQINIKYTLLSREIVARQAQHKTNKQNRKDKGKDEQMVEDCNARNLEPYSNSKNTFPSSKLSIKNAFSNRSILKNKAGGLNKQKRISIQIITSLLQTERSRKSKLFPQEKESRFKHRLALNIGSFQNVHSLQAKGQRKMKKQVKIENVEARRFEQEDELGRENQDGSSKNLSSKSKSKRQVNLMKYQQLCEKADQDEDDSKSKCSIFRRKKWESWHQSVVDSQSACTIGSKSSKKSKNRVKIIMNLSKRRDTRKFTLNQRNMKSYNSCKDIKAIKSSRNIREKTDLNQSLKNIFVEALEKKKNKASSRAGRSGKIIEEPISNEADQIKQSYEEEPKKTYKLRMNNNHKAHKNKYRLILESHQKSKDNSYEENKEMPKKYIQRRPSRRYGITSPSQIDKFKMSHVPFMNNGNKNMSLTLSASSGSRRLQISNNKIGNNETGMLNQKHTAGKKMKTEERAADGLEIPAEFKVSLTDRLNFVDDFVKFYPHVECSLYSITKKQERIEFLSGGQPQNQMLQFGPMPNYLIKKHGRKQSQGETIEREVQKKMFQQENLKLNFSKKIVAAANQLQQKELPEHRGGHLGEDPQ